MAPVGAAKVTFLPQLPNTTTSLSSAAPFLARISEPPTGRYGALVEINRAAEPDVAPLAALLDGRPDTGITRWPATVRVLPFFRWAVGT